MGMTPAVSASAERVEMSLSRTSSATCARPSRQRTYRADPAPIASANAPAPERRVAPWSFAKAASHALTAGDVHGRRRALQRDAAEADAFESVDLDEPGVHGRRGRRDGGRPDSERALQRPPRVAQLPEEAHLHRGDAPLRGRELRAGLLQLLAERVVGILAQASRIVGSARPREDVRTAA